MDKLFSPWRLRYIRGAGRTRERGCVFCRAVSRGNDRSNLVLLRGRWNYIILNKYPYNNGHMMVVPFAHGASLASTSPETIVEMMNLVVRCESALRQAYRPTGINLGMNLGRSAGAGIEEHLHLHIVPRWDWDTNFMSVVHGTRVIPESLQATYRRLRPLLLAEVKRTSRPVGERPRRPARSAGGKGR